MHRVWNTAWWRRNILYYNIYINIYNISICDKCFKRDKNKKYTITYKSLNISQKTQLGLYFENKFNLVMKERNE